MSPIAVVADSACDLPPHEAARVGVRVVPLTVTFGEESFRDGEELTPEAFWDRVEASPDLPTTASPAPAALLEAYRAAAAAGADGIVSVHVSGKLSRTLDSAQTAAAESPVPVEVVDSRSVSLGIALVALAAARAGADGRGLAETAAATRAAADRVQVVAFLDTVEFLKRGGRVGRAKAALSDLLRVRPVLSLDDGETVLVARSRTRGRAIEEVLARAEGPAEAAAVLHGGAEEAAAVAVRLASACGVEPIVALIGAVTGTHLGPRALGIAVLRPAGHR